MTSPEAQRFLLDILSRGLNVLLFGMLASWVWAAIRLSRGRPLLPERPILRLPLASWGAGTTLGVVALYLGTAFASPLIRDAIVGRPEKPPIEAADAVEDPIDPTEPGAPEGDGDVDVLDDEAPSEPRPIPESEDAPEDADEPEPEATEVEPEVVMDPRRAHEVLVLNALGNLLFLACFPFVFYGLCGATAADLGLSLREGGRQLGVGLLAGLVAMPAIYLVQAIAVQVWSVSAHPVQKMLESEFDPRAADLAILTAVILAPVVEELLFRGLLQGWLTRILLRSPRRVTVNASALPDSEVDPTADAPATSPPADAPANDPAPPLVAADDVSNVISWPALILTSLLFAAVHGPQWPAPIALFVFSMILGVVYQRTGSLLSVMAMHALFNGCSTFFLLLQQLTRSVGGDAVGEGLEPVPAFLAACWGHVARLLS